MSNDTLHAERMHLAGLLEAIQRCVYFLNASDEKHAWPLTAAALEQNKKSIDLFESLAAINERFAKLQDTLGAAMRHSVLLSGETGETFLKVLAFYEKTGVIDSIASWQLCRATRNLAAHDYGTDYAEVAEHFNALHSLIPILYGDAHRFVAYCRDTLEASPLRTDFDSEFSAITRDSIGQNGCPT
ncbi:MAG: hypothetical protein B7Y26_11635 [Hydrogenophilales bacterium 16-64-46]|nr:MAG: hypothetical protein B7Y26_11635 [Hydrogenophilales bacterium 16-64-46]OZA38260.1 MAG: hypothetical protein B7X87_07115 [Hydrogenophilales bacterium 17-64-34]HQS99164.1 hypothetical protein [Thiobacillus sp.]